MSLRDLMPHTQDALYYGQNGMICFQINNLHRSGHAGGHSGGGIQSYVEYLFGDTCGKSVATDSTSGTKFFPNIEYVIGFMGQGRDTNTQAEVDVEIMADSITASPFAAQVVNGNGTYDPDSGVSYYLHPINGDMIFGKFNRVAVYKTGTSTIKSRVVMQLGPSNGRGDT